MIIGAISDSHRETKVAASAIEWLLARGADLLVHAGDIVESETLRLLRQSSKPYFAILGNNDEALAELKNEFNLHDEPFCTEFAGLRLKIMHHPFYLFDEEPAAQNEADRPSFAADFGSRTDTDRAANLNSNFNAADVDKILNDARRADVNFKNIHSASANFKSGQSASLNVSLGVNTDSDMNSNANLAASTSPDIISKASSGADRAVNLTAPSLSANLSAPNSCVNLAALSLGSNLTANSDPNASGESKNRGPCGCGADKISTIKIYGHTHYFAAAVDKNGALVLNPGEICGHKKRLFGLPVLWCKSGNCAYFVSVRSAKNYKATERKS